MEAPNINMQVPNSVILNGVKNLLLVLSVDLTKAEKADPSLYSG